MRALHGRLSGLCQPTYVLDIPGGHGKVADRAELSVGCRWTAGISWSRISTDGGMPIRRGHDCEVQGSVPNRQ